MSKVNLPMDVAREISKYNDQTSVIEKLKAENEKLKARAYDDLVMFWDEMDEKKQNERFINGVQYGQDLEDDEWEIY